MSQVWKLAREDWETHGRPVVERAKREVLDDIASGTVPPTVKTYSELHDFVDANYYGGAFESDIPDDGPSQDLHLAFWNRVQAEVDAWLRAGRPE